MSKAIYGGSESLYVGPDSWAQPFCLDGYVLSAQNGGFFFQKNLTPC